MFWAPLTSKFGTPSCDSWCVDCSDAPPPALFGTILDSHPLASPRAYAQSAPTGSQWSPPRSPVHDTKRDWTLHPRLLARASHPITGPLTTGVYDARPHGLVMRGRRLRQELRDGADRAESVPFCGIRPNPKGFGTTYGPEPGEDINSRLLRTKSPIYMTRTSNSNERVCSSRVYIK